VKLLVNTYESILPALDAVPVSAVVRQMLATFCPIFMLHRIECFDRGIEGHRLGMIRQQLEYIHKRGYKPIALSTLARCIAENTPIPEKAVAFSIDDGFIDHFDLAGPIFSEYGVPLHYFLITDFVNGDTWPWDDQVKCLFDLAPLHIKTISIAGIEIDVDLSTTASRKTAVNKARSQLKKISNSNLFSHLQFLYEQLETEPQLLPPPAYQAMNWGNANSLLTMGHEIGAHTKTHRILSQLTQSESEDEILGSIRAVTAMTGQCSPVFCYPTGRYSDFKKKEESILKNSGCFAAVTNRPEHLGQHHNQYQLPRLSLPSTMVDFIQYISWIEYAKNKARRILHT
jgi:peptidoglycan/xylan/chitin deacetylase (PgdA/CDA1 family)